MSRLSALRNEIDKGLSVDEKSGHQIADWSPNNVRRLVIAFGFAIVQYHVTGRKYPKLLSVVMFKDSDISEDVDALHKNKYKSLLTSLTVGRVCSSIEEIYILSDTYPDKRMSILDSDMNVLTGNNSDIKNRFVRLRHVSSISVADNGRSPGEWVFELFRNSASGLITSLDELQDRKVLYSSISVRRTQDIEVSDWWKRTALRGKIYTMDSLKLDKHFEGIRLKKETIEVDKKSAENRLLRMKDKYAATIKVVNALTPQIADLLESAGKFLSGMGVLDLAEWGHALKPLVVKEESRGEKRTERSTLNTFVYEAAELKTNGMLEEDVHPLFKSIMPYVSTVPGVNMSEDIPTPERVKLLIYGSLTAVNNAYYKALYLFLYKNTKKYIHYHGTLLGDMSTLSYTRLHSEECNKIDTGYEEKDYPVFSDAGMVLLTVEDYRRVQETQKLKAMFQNYLNGKGGA